MLDTVLKGGRLTSGRASSAGREIHLPPAGSDAKGQSCNHAVGRAGGNGIRGVEQGAWGKGFLLSSWGDAHPAQGVSLEWKGAEAGRERLRWDHSQDVNVRMRKEAEVGD